MYLYMKLLQSSTIFKQKTFLIKFLYEIFTTLNSKNIILTLRIVTIEKSELVFLLVLIFRALGEEKHLEAQNCNTPLPGDNFMNFHKSFSEKCVSCIGYIL